MTRGQSIAGTSRPFAATAPTQLHRTPSPHAGRARIDGLRVSPRAALTGRRRMPGAASATPPNGTTQRVLRCSRSTPLRRPSRNTRKLTLACRSPASHGDNRETDADAFSSSRDGHIAPIPQGNNMKSPLMGLSGTWLAPSCSRMPPVAPLLLISSSGSPLSTSHVCSGFQLRNHRRGTTSPACRVCQRTSVAPRGMSRTWSLNTLEGEKSKDTIRRPASCPQKFVLGYIVAPLRITRAGRSLRHVKVRHWGTTRWRSTKARREV